MRITSFPSLPLPPQPQHPFLLNLHPMERVKRSIWTPSDEMPSWLLVVYRIMALVPFAFLALVVFFYFSASGINQVADEGPLVEVEKPIWKRPQEIIAGSAALASVAGGVVYRATRGSGATPFYPTLSGALVLGGVAAVTVTAGSVGIGSHKRRWILGGNTKTYEICRHLFGLLYTKLGKGGFGTTYLAVSNNEKNLLKDKKVVLKIPKEHWERSTQREASFLNRVNSSQLPPGERVPFVIKLREFIKEKCALVLPLFEADLWHEVCRKRRKTLSIEEGLYCMRQMLFALAGLKEKGVIHGDLNTNNIFIKKNIMNQKIDTFVLADFGIASTPTEKQEIGRRLRRFLSPEELRGDEKIDYGIDMWSLGCVMVDVILGKRFFEERKEDADFEEQKIINYVHLEELLKYGFLDLQDTYGNELEKMKEELMEVEKYKKQFPDEEERRTAIDQKIKQYREDHEKKRLAKNSIILPYEDPTRGNFLTERPLGGLINQMLQPKEKRISIEDALQHGCFRVFPTLKHNFINEADNPVRVTVFDSNLVRQRMKKSQYTTELTRETFELRQNERLGEVELSENGKDRKEKCMQLTTSTNGHYGFFIEDKSRKLLISDIEISLDKLSGTTTRSSGPTLPQKKELDLTQLINRAKFAEKFFDLSIQV